MSVAAFGDGALATFVAGRFLAGNQSEEGHELTWAFEATEITQFADDGHGGDFLESFAGHEGFDDGTPLPIGENLFEFFFEGLDAFEAAVDGLEVSFQNERLGGIREGEVTEVAHVGAGPLGLLVVSKAVAQEEGIESLFGAGEVIRSIGASAAEVAHGFIQSGRDADFGEVAVAEEFCDLLGIAFVGLDFFVGFALCLGGRHDDAIDLELPESSSEDEAGGAGFVADLEVLEFDAEFFGESTQGAFGGEVGAPTGAVEGGM